MLLETLKAIKHTHINSTRSVQLRSLTESASCYGVMRQLAETSYSKKDHWHIPTFLANIVFNANQLLNVLITGNESRKGEEVLRGIDTLSFYDTKWLEGQICFLLLHSSCDSTSDCIPVSDWLTYCNNFIIVPYVRFVN